MVKDLLVLLSVELEHHLKGKF